MDLKTWLEAEKGRAAALAEHIGVTAARVSQWKKDGVPLAHMKVVRDFTNGAVSLEEMVPGEGRLKADAPSAQDRRSTAETLGSVNLDRINESRRRDGPSKE